MVGGLLLLLLLLTSAAPSFSVRDEDIVASLSAASSLQRPPPGRRQQRLLGTRFAASGCKQAGGNCTSNARASVLLEGGDPDDQQEKKGQARDDGQEKTEEKAEDGGGFKFAMRGSAWSWLIGLAVFVVVLLIVGGFCRRASDGSLEPPVDAAADTAAAAGAPGAGGPAPPHPPVDPDSPEGKLHELKRTKLKMMMENARSKQQLEKVLIAIGEYEAVLAARTKPSQEELARKAMAELEGADLVTERNLTKLIAYVAPVMMQGHRVMSVVEKRVDEIRGKAVAMAMEQTQGLAEDVKDIFGVKEMEMSIFNLLNNMEIYSLATLLAGAFAPVQLKLLYSSNRWSLIQVGSFLLVSILVLCVDRNLCNGWVEKHPGMVTPHQLYSWFVVDASISVFCVLVRLWAHCRLGGIVETINDPPPMPPMASPIAGIKILLDHYMTYGAEALINIDIVLGSPLYALSNWTVVFNLVWLGYGTDLVANMPWVECHPLGLAVLRFRVVLFLTLILPNIVNLALFFVSRFMEGQRFQVLVLGTAYQVDEFLGLGLPVAVVLAQSLLVRNKGDMVRLQIKTYELRKADLEAKEKAAQATLSEVQAAKVKAEQEIQKLSTKLSTDESLSPAARREKLAKEKEEILHEAEHVFQRLNESAAKASAEAEQQVQKWKEGEGPEFLQAMARGEGLATLQEVAQRRLAEQDWSKEALAAQLAALQEQGAALAATAAESEWGKAAIAKGSELATTAADSEWGKAAMAKGSELATQAADSEWGKAAMQQGTTLAATAAAHDWKADAAAIQASAASASAAAAAQRAAPAGSAAAPGAALVAAAAPAAPTAAAAAAGPAAQAPLPPAGAPAAAAGGAPPAASPPSHL